MKTKSKNIIWLFSEFMDGSHLFGDFCKQHGYITQTTGDWEYFGDIIRESEHIAALFIDADQYEIEDLVAILEKIKSIQKIHLFNGRIYFLSKNPQKHEEIHHIHRVCLEPKPTAVTERLLSLVH